MKKKAQYSRGLSLSPIHPSLHFIVFLILAFVLVMVVAFAMNQTGKAARATLMCPNSVGDQTNLITELSHRCPEGVEYTKDANGCGVWVCKLP